MAPVYFDKDGSALSFEDWCLKFEDLRYRRVRLSRVYDGDELITISTVWLGMAHGHSPEGPVIFETLVSSDKNSEREMYRYATEQRARDHHEHLINIAEHDAKKANRFIKILKDLDDVE